MEREIRKAIREIFEEAAKKDLWEKYLFLRIHSTEL